MGIEDTDKIEIALKATGETVAAIVKAYEDKQIAWNEVVFQILPKALGFIKVVRNGKEFLAEWKDLDDIEREKIKIKFKEHFDLPNDTIETIIEGLFSWLVSGADIVEKFSDALKKK